MIAFIGTTKTYASITTQIHLTHSFYEEPVDGKSYELNGFKYQYSASANRLYAGLITENPEDIKTIVFYDQLYDIPVLYIYISSLEAYTGLEDIIAFDLSNPNNIIKNLSIKNLYMAHANVFPIDAKTMTVENYHFVAPYEASETNFDTYNSKSKIDEMQFDNTYYYDFNQLFFQKVVDEYNARSTKEHNFQLRNESSLKYTKESFYPSDDYQLTLEKSGIKYYHKVGYDVPVYNASNDQIPYVPYAIDPRVKSATVTNISGPGILTGYSFKTLDAQGYSVSGLQSFKGETLIASNNAYTLNTSGLNFKNIYFVYDSTQGAITSVNATGQHIENIYIPEDNKTPFQVIIDHASLGPKVQYYTNAPGKVYFEFASDDGQTIYKSSDDYIDIDTILDSIQKIEALGIDLSNESFVNQTVESYGFPTKKVSSQTITLKPITDIHLNKGMDPRIVVEAMKDKLVNGNATSIVLNFDSEDLSLIENSQFKIDAVINNQPPTTRVVNVKYNEFNQTVAFIKSGNELQLITNKSDDKTFGDIFKLYTDIVLKNQSVTLNIDAETDLKIEKTIASSFTYNNEGFIIHAYVTNKSLAQTYINYELPDTFMLTKNIDINKVIQAVKGHLLFKEGDQVDEAYTIAAEQTATKLTLMGTYPNGQTFNVTVTFLVLDSDIGEYIIYKHTKTNTYTLFIEARTIKDDVDAKSIFKSYFESHELDAYIDQYELSITLTKPGTLTEKITLEDTEDTFTVKVVVTDKDLNFDNFKDPFKTDKDAYGEIDLFTKIQDKLSENDILKWSTIALSSIVGIVILYFIYVGIKKGMKWLKN